MPRFLKILNMPQGLRRTSVSTGSDHEAKQAWQLECRGLQKFVSDGPIPDVEVPRVGWGVGSVVVWLIFDEPQADAPMTWEPNFSVTIDGDGPGTSRPDAMLENYIRWMEDFIMIQVAKGEAGLLTIGGAE